jgi:hypothetical protein
MSKLTKLCCYGQKALMASSRYALLSSSSRQPQVSRIVINTNNSYAVNQTIHKFSTLRSPDVVETDPASDIFYEGHLLTDQLEYIDIIMDKAVEIEESIDRLHTLTQKKKEVALNVQWMDSADIEALFQESQKQKKIIRELVANVKELSNEVKGRFNGVDAPDGTSDDMVQKDRDAVDSIIYDAWVQQKRDEQAIRTKANCDSKR